MSATHKFSVSPRDVGKYEAALGRSFTKTIRDSMKKSAKEAIGILMEATLIAKPASDTGASGAFNTGLLGYSFHVEADAQHMNTSSKTPLAIKQGVRVITVAVTNAAPYFDYVNGVGSDQYGRHPGTKPPPFHVIEAWLISRWGWNAHDAKWYSKILAAKIGREGLRARNIVRDARPEIVKLYQEDIINALRSWVRVKP